MLIVHHLNQSRSKRVLWLLEELEMPYQRIDHQRDAQTHLAPPSLKAVHPLSKAPVIVDGDVTLCESGAIMEYILNQVPSNTLRPDVDSDAYYHYLEWLHFAEGSLSLPVISSLIMSMETRDGTMPLDGYIAKELQLDLSYIENTLRVRRYFSGDCFSAADIMMSVMLEIAENIGLLENRPKIINYLVSMKQRQAYQKAAKFG